jgi:hypothetical protein
MFEKIGRYAETVATNASQSRRGLSRVKHKEAPVKTIIFLGVVLGSLAVLSAPAHGGTLSATGVLSATPAGGGNFDYTITLTNTSGPGGDHIGTFWYSWVPGEGFLPSLPTGIVAPTGWTDMITNGPPPTDGYSIQFVAGSGFELAPGGSLLFQFVSVDTPSTLNGMSTIHPGTPVGTSTLYQMGPFAGDTATITVSSVPEPSTGTLAIVGGVASIPFLRRRRQAF